MNRSWTRPTASWHVLALAGIVAAFAVAVTGRVAERLWLGADDRTAAARVEASVREMIGERAASLRAVTRTLVSTPSLSAAVDQRQSAAPALFALLDRATPNAPSDLAVTIYGIDRQALAWTGRPSTLPPDRLDGPPALFVAPGPLGLRLVYVEPVLVREPRVPPRRVGAVAAERVLSPSDGARALATRSYRIEAAIVPVAVRPRFAGAGALPAFEGFLVRASTGEVLLQAQVSRDDLHLARWRVRRIVLGATLAVLAATVLVIGVPLHAWRYAARAPRPWLVATLALAAVIVGARALAWVAWPAELATANPLAGMTGSAVLRLLDRTPLDFLLTALALTALVALAGSSLRRVRAALRRARHDPTRGLATGARFVAWLSTAGTAAGALAISFELLLRRTIEQASIDILNLSLAPWDTPRLLLIAGFVFLNAAAWWAMVLIFVASLLPWRVCLSCPRSLAVLAVGWLAPGSVLVALGRWRNWDLPATALLLLLVTAAAVAWLAVRRLGRYRRGSEALRLVAFVFALVVPALLLYPSLLHFAERARQRLVETQFAAQAQRHPEELLRRLQETRARLDATAPLVDTIRTLAADPRPPQTDEAFLLWQQTPLAEGRLTSDIELYGADGRLLSRFALNFPEYVATRQRWRPTSCAWEVFGEAAPFGAEERRMLHAERGVCDASGRMIGGIVVHVVPDYSALPFLSSQNPYYELLRGSRADARQALPRADVGLVIYGWGRTPLYTSIGRAWSLEDQLFRRVYRSRQPFWTKLLRGDTWHHVYVANDRYGIYILDYPAPRLFDHLVHLADLATIAALLGIALLVAGGLLWQLAWHREKPVLRLVREVRTSFYRKLFLAFVAAAVVPVVILALAARTYVAGRLRADVEAEASRTAAVARRVIEESLALQQSGEHTLSAIDDDIMVWISRVIEQDVNIFEGPQLIATSERDLFASGLLPTRVPENVYRAIVLERLPSFVGEDEVAELKYLLAAAPVRAAGRDAVLTVPMTLRQREIEREIDELDEGVHLGSLLLILLGAAIGLWMAERIGDPVQRLTRASKRIAEGDLDARVFVRSADELKRLVEAFNLMAFELQRQRAQLERTNRLEAWAEMARQVAHDIKNPLTPIQLSAEHLRRVHTDRGEPLSPVLESCVDTILTQVRLLRQISSEFSSFATTPVARPVETDLASLIDEVTSAYRSGLAERIALVVDIEPGLPRLSIDRTLVGRAVTNVIENALHAMPGSGVLRIAVRREGGDIVIEISDTGVGMDTHALSRIFEPYFSTKAIGTGLGLTIAKRNLDLHGGTIEVRSTKGRGTAVTLRLPIESPVAPASAPLATV